jgi:hypothetical protein
VSEVKVGGEPAGHVAVRVAPLLGVTIESLSQKPRQGSRSRLGTPGDGRRLDPVIDRKGPEPSGISPKQFLGRRRPPFRDLLRETRGGWERDARKGILLWDRPEVFSQLTLQVRIQALTVHGVFHAVEKQETRKQILKGHSHMREFLSHPEAEIISVRANSFLFLDGISDAHQITLAP